MKKMKILAFGGSFRKGSFSKIVLKETKYLLPSDVDIKIFDIKGISFFNQDLEQNLPENVVKFKLEIKNADAILIVTPEYNYSIPGFLKNAIDWASRPISDNSFNEKPVAIISSSTGMFGGSRAQYHLRQSFVFLNSYVLNKPEVMIPFVDQKIHSNRLKDEKTKEKIKEILKALSRFALEIKKMKNKA